MKKQNQDELVFLPLGGSDEVGMNLNAYGFGPEADREWLIVDVGVTFGDLKAGGAEAINMKIDMTFTELSAS
jgi:ribonuclease J